MFIDADHRTTWCVYVLNVAQLFFLACVSVGYNLRFPTEAIFWATVFLTLQFIFRVFSLGTRTCVQVLLRQPATDQGDASQVDGGSENQARTARAMGNLNLSVCVSLSGVVCGA